MTASTEWTDFVKLVEAAMRVEKSIAGAGVEGGRIKTGQTYSSSRVDSTR